MMSFQDVPDKYFQDFTRFVLEARELENKILIFRRAKFLQTHPYLVIDVLNY